jgi:hypothetical protein
MDNDYYSMCDPRLPYDQCRWHGETPPLTEDDFIVPDVVIRSNQPKERDDI